MDDKEPVIYPVVRHLFDENIAFNKYIGMQISRLGYERISINFDAKPELLGNPVHKILHGGVISTALDQAGGLMAMMSMLQNSEASTLEDLMSLLKSLGTIDLRVDYLRPGRGKSFQVNAEILRLGNKIAVTRMELYNESDYRIAVGTGTYLVS